MVNRMQMAPAGLDHRQNDTQAGISTLRAKEKRDGANEVKIRAPKE
jgi:hypothetical protein